MIFAIVIYAVAMTCANLGIDHQIRQAIKAFCRINAGKRIPADGEVCS